jgi:hypothetical protein
VRVPAAGGPAPISPATCQAGARTMPAPSIDADPSVSRLLAHSRPVTLIRTRDAPCCNRQSAGPVASENTRQSCRRRSSGVRGRRAAPDRVRCPAHHHLDVVADVVYLFLPSHHSGRLLQLILNRRKNNTTRLRGVCFDIFRGAADARGQERRASTGKRHLILT